MKIQYLFANVCSWILILYYNYWNCYWEKIANAAIDGDVWGVVCILSMTAFIH